MSRTPYVCTLLCQDQDRRLRCQGPRGSAQTWKRQCTHQITGMSSTATGVTGVPLLGHKATYMGTWCASALWKRAGRKRSQTTRKQVSVRTKPCLARHRVARAMSISLFKFAGLLSINMSNFVCPRELSVYVQTFLGAPSSVSSSVGSSSARSSVSQHAKAHLASCRTNTYRRVLRWVTKVYAN